MRGKVELPDPTSIFPPPPGAAATPLPRLARVDCSSIAGGVARRRREAHQRAAPARSGGKRRPSVGALEALDLGGGQARFLQAARERRDQGVIRHEREPEPQDAQERR